MNIYKHSIFKMIMLLSGIYVGLIMVQNPAHASDYITLTKGEGVIRHNRVVVQKVKLPYISKRTIPINQSRVMRLTWDDQVYNSDGTVKRPATTTKYLLKVRSLTYYRLKTNKYNKKTVVRYHYSAKGISGMKYSFQLFTNQFDLSAEKVKTADGHKLYQSTANYGENDLYQPRIKGTTKILRRNVDFASKKLVPLKSLKHAAIYYEASDVQQQYFKY